MSSNSNSVGQGSFNFILVILAILIVVLLLYFVVTRIGSKTGIGSGETDPSKLVDSIGSPAK